MKYDEINWMGWLVNIVCFIGLFCIFVLLFGYGGIFWFIGAIIVGIIIGWRKEPKKIQTIDDDYFTDEDFIHCKVGEWVSRK
jgi:hypothetical protein